MTTPVNLCAMCARLTELWKCEAYPDGIPPEILTKEVDHRKPHEGDHGLQFISHSEKKKS